MPSVRQRVSSCRVGDVGVRFEGHAPIISGSSRDPDEASSLNHCVVERRDAYPHSELAPACHRNLRGRNGNCIGSSICRRGCGLGCDNGGSSAHFHLVDPVEVLSAEYHRNFQSSGLCARCNQRIACHDAARICRVAPPSSYLYRCGRRWCGRCSRLQHAYRGERRVDRFPCRACPAV